MEQLKKFAMLFSFLSFSLFSEVELPEPSRPEEINAFNQDSLLIGGVVSPLSGQPCLVEKDLVAKGAEDVTLKRIYLAPFFLNSYDSSNNKDKAIFYQLANGAYKGWSYFPHQRLSVRPQKDGESLVRFTTPNGVTLEFLFKDGKCKLNQELFGMSNFASDEPSGKYDLRNIKIDIHGKEKIIVQMPDGIVLHYKYVELHSATLFTVYPYCLEKEVLPNGKVIKYFFDHGKLCRIESQDINERHTYASINVKHLPKAEQSFTTEFTSNSNQKAFYRFEYRKEENKYGTRGKIKSPRFLSSVVSPFHTNEQLHYSPRVLLDEIKGRKELFQCQYDTVAGSSRESSFLGVKSLLLPVGKNGNFIAAHTFHYEQPDPGKKSGSTTVVNSDGTRTVYLINKNLLLSGVQYYDQNGSLKKEKVFHYDDNQRLTTFELKDSRGVVLSKCYAYDDFGNPIQEILKGNLQGYETSDYRIINRKFSQDGRNLLLMEEFEEGLTFFYQYLPHTNLITAKFTKEKNKILKREFCDYDDCYNLVCKITDDGDTEDKNDIEKVTERHIRRYLLRHQQPFLHMCEWDEECYLENKQEKPFKRTHYHYDNMGNVCQEDVYDFPENKERLAYTIYKEYNGRGDLLSETNAIGQKKTYTYDEFGLCRSSTNFSRRKTVEHEYDKRARLVKEKMKGEDCLYREISFDHDTQDRVILKVDEFQNASHYTYDCISNKITHTESPLSSNGMLVVNTSEYDALDHEISKTDANGNRTQYSYTLYGKPTRILYADGTSESFFYNKNWTLKQHINLDGQITNYEHDPFGRVLTIENVSSKKNLRETYHYNSFHLLKKIDRCGVATTYSYDALGRKSAEEFAGSRTEYQYDSLGRQCAVIKHNDDNTLVIKWKKDLLDRVLEELKTDLRGNILFQIHFGYDQDGNRKSVTRFIGNEPATETFSYDSFNRLVEHQDGFQHLTHYFYDENHINSLGQRVLKKTVVNPKNQKRIEVSDPFGQITAKEYLDNEDQRVAFEEFIYDPANNLIGQKQHVHTSGIFQRVDTVHFTYDKRNGLESFTRGLGSDLRTTKMAYTPSGKVTEKTLPDLTTLTYTYDPFGNLHTITSSNGSVNHHFEYDCLGRVLKAEDLVNHITIERNLNAFGNVKKEHFSTGLEITKTYDALQRPLEATFSSGKTVQYQYDPLYLRSITLKDPETKNSFTHHYESYDLNGNLQSEQLLNNLGIIEYAYDHNNQTTLLKSQHLTESYRYDALGNRIEKQTEKELSKYVYDELSQLISENGGVYKYDSNQNRIHKNGRDIQNNALNEIVSYDGSHYSYDLNGNLKTRQVNGALFTLEYDSLNRLTKATSKNETIKYLYDPFGRRLQKQSDTNTENYLYDGEQEIAAFDNNHLKQFRISNTLTSFNKPILIGLEGRIYAPVCDPQGNVRQLISAETKQLEGKTEFTAYGELLSDENAIFNPWRFSSKRYDPELNLVYYGKRYYAPELGRWLTSDPAGFVDGLNLYHYLHNNPYYYFDADGQNAVIIIPFIKIAWGAAAISVTTASIPYLIGAAAVCAAVYGTNRAISYLNDRHIMNQINSQAEQQYETDEEKKKKPPYCGQELGEDPTKCPGEGFEWKGSGPPESGQGAWVKGKRPDQESLHPDLQHPPPDKPHWDYETSGSEEKAKLYLDGTFKWGKK